MTDEIHTANVSAASVVEAPSLTVQAELKALECLLLGMADRYLADNLLHQAAEMYFEVVDRYLGAPESSCARQRLLEIAEHYENIGAPHQARGIYERLL
ncbi:MAG: hypothetical protein ABSA67_06275 [Candidatus Brocadiia bacterium]|jgi:hypothetical protein